MIAGRSDNSDDEKPPYQKQGPKPMTAEVDALVKLLVPTASAEASVSDSAGGPGRQKYGTLHFLTTSVGFMH